MANYAYYKDIFSNEPVKTDIMLELAKLELFQNKYDNAFLYLKRILSEFGSSEAASSAYNIIEKNRAKFKDLIDIETEIDLTMMLVKKGQYNRAIPTLELIYDSYAAQNKLNDIPEIVYSLGWSYYKLRSAEFYDTAAFYFDTTVNNFPASDYASKSLFYNGVIMMRKSDMQNSMEFMEQIIKNNNNDYFSFAAFKEIIEHAKSSNNSKKLVETFERMKNYFNGPDKKKYYIDSIWQYFFYAMQIGNYTKAKELAESIKISKGIEDYDRMKSNFWLLKLYLRTNDGQQANKCYEELLKTDNFNSFYFWRSNELIKEFHSGSDYTVLPGFDSSDETELFAKLLELSKSNKLLWMLALYKDHEDLGLLTDFNDKSINNKKMKILIRYIAGKYSSAIDNAARLPLEEQKEFASILYPLAYKNYVIENTRNLKFNNHLPFAIIREESKFTKSVSSIAGAIGLMQIMPATGKGIAELLNYVDFDSSALFQPEINIKFGTYELCRLFKNWRKLVNVDLPAIIFTIASYNGGESNVKRWKPKYYDIGEDIDLFIELIPYKETRNYVFRVYKSYKVYQSFFDKYQ